MGKHNNIKRDKRITVSFTEEERERLKRAAEKTVYKSVSSLCREVMLQIIYFIEENETDEKISINIIDN